MKRHSSLIRGFSGLACAGILALAVGGCDTAATKPSDQSLAPTTKAAAPSVAPTPTKLAAIRIKAGVDADLKDSKGVVWSAERGFEGGSSIDRAGQITITGTETPEIYMAEHYSMDSWSTPVPNGKYTVKLHFSEDYDGISSATDRVFTYAVKDGTAAGKTIKEVKDFSPWKAAGAQFKAYVDSVPVTVTTGQLTITFTAQVENPQINAIEVVPN